MTLMFLSGFCSFSVDMTIDCDFLGEVRRFFGGAVVSFSIVFSLSTDCFLYFDIYH